MEQPVTQQPQIVEVTDFKVPGAPGCGPVTVRNLTNSKSDSEFAGRLVVEAFRSKVVHATSERCLPKVIKGQSLDHQIQDPLFYQHNFVAEYDNQLAGLMRLKFKGDPDVRSSSEHYRDIGFCDGLRLWWAGASTDVSVPQDKCYLDHICVDERFRGKGIGKVLLDRAEYEGRKFGCKKIYLLVTSDNRAARLYRRQGYVEKSRLCCCGCFWCAIGTCVMVEMEKALY